jgi:Novel toxin 21
MEPVKDAPFDSHGQKVFKIGNYYFSLNVDTHSGGVWKEYDRRGNRVGTLDVNLNRIGK